MTQIIVRPLTSTDLPLGMRLKSAAGWNQTEADWRRALSLDPQGSFVGQLDGADVGTVASVTFGPVAWIGLMLVDPAARGRGVGKRLMLAALEYLDRRGVMTVRLDATPQGEPLYRQLGFAADFLLHRWSGRPQTRESKIPSEIAPIGPANLSAVAQLDRQITRTDRSPLIAALLDETPRLAHLVRRDDRVAGYLLSRAGTNATQIGPCLADDPDAGAALLRFALARLADQPVFIDIPEVNEPARAIAQEHGLAIQRPLQRMTRGAKVAEQAEKIWAAFGPEKG